MSSQQLPPPSYIQSTLPPVPAYTAPPAQALGAVSAPAPTVPQLNFTLNGTEVMMDAATMAAKGITPNTKLAEYLRTTKWTGTKISCNEGGCGACLVALTFDDPVSGATTTRAINSCLRPLYSCNGMSITTNDGLGTPSNPHAIQTALAEANGSQCGFCSNGMVMNLYALMSSNPQLTKLEIEQAYDGNLCRCTGYRQILHAMKSFATPTDGVGEELPHQCEEKSCLEVGCKRKGVFPELEELDRHMAVPESVKNYKHQLPVPHKKKGMPTISGSTPSSSGSKLTINANGAVWQDCPTIADLDFWLEWYTSHHQKPMLVVAQTSLAVCPREVNVKLNIAKIPKLCTITQTATGGVTVGPSVPIADVIAYLGSATGPHSYSTSHFPQAKDHLGRVASTPIRNIASIGGNLMLCHNHQAADNYFPSDIAIVMMGLGATISYKKVGTGGTTTTGVSMTDFFTTDFTGKYVTGITIPWALENEKFMSYKIAIRQVNSHAIVNSAMRMVVDPTTHLISGSPTVAYGGVFTKPTRMTATEATLASGTFNVTSSTAFQTLCTALETNLVPCTSRLMSYRKSVALSQIYKFFLFLQPSLSGSGYEASVAPWFVRPESTGSTAFTPDPTRYPVDIGMTKVEAIQQTTGHAKYTDDLVATEDTLYAHMILADQGNATLQAIDSTVAASMPGFKAFYTNSDLPQENLRNTWEDGYLLTPVGTTIDHAGHAVGILVATTAQFAAECAKHVVVKYSDAKPNIVTIPEALAASPPSLYSLPAGTIPEINVGNAASVIAATPAANKVTSTVSLGWQYHMHMENQACFVTPREDVMEVQAATQSPMLVQEFVAQVLGVPRSKVTVSVKRCGGGFGGKGSNSVPQTVLAAFCAKKLGVPVKLYMPQEQNWKMLGGRGARQLDYTVAFANDGTLTALDATVTAAGGANGLGVFGANAPAPRESFGAIVNVANLDNCYKIPNFRATGQIAITNTPPSASTRGPGWVPAVAMAEMIVARVAKELSISPDTVREKNFFKKGDTTGDGMHLPYWDMPKIWSQLTETSGYAARRTAVTTFNSDNKWVKKGLAMMPCRFAVAIAGGNYDTIVNIYGDGTIGVTIGGVEIGQGINTKIIQVVAFKLGLTKEDMPNITINETCTRSLSAMTNSTGGSITSDLCSLSVLHACETLNARLAPFRRKGQTWTDLIQGVTAIGSVQLTATGWTAAPAAPNSTGMFNYNSTSAAVCEVELDCLSGEYELKRVDILFDCGISINPVIDIGQVQGGFVYGQGYFLQEEIRYDEATGQSLDPSTWEYKPPSAYDVPLEFNVTLLGNTPNPLGVLGSKVCGEPPVCLAAVVTHALEDAVSSCLGTRWVCEKTPLTVPDIQTACAPAISQFNF